MSANASEQQAPTPSTNGTHKAPRKRRTKAQMATAKAGAPAARKTPTPEPVVAQRTIAPAAGTQTRPAVISNVVVSTFGALTERLDELQTERAVLVATIDGRIAEVRKMLAVAQPRAASPGKRKATGKRKARAKAKAKAPMKQAA